MMGERGRRGELFGTLAGVLAALLLTAAAAAPATGAIRWHAGLDEALAAAEESGKPIFAFVYLGEERRDTSGPREEIYVHRPNAPQARGQVDMQQMLRETLSDESVIAAARKFEAVKLDLCDPSTDAARIALRVAPGVDQAAATRVGMYPITVFLDPGGEELFRRHGCLPAAGYAAQLETAWELHEKRKAVLEDPRDAVKRRELGRAYMEMDPTPEDRIYEAALEHLQAAIRLDPENAAGAKFDASVDLAILSIPQSPEQAIQRLFHLQSEDEDGHRKLESQYYMAVAHFVNEDLASARRLLREFETNDERSPYWDSPWTPQALGLLEYIKRVER